MPAGTRVHKCVEEVKAKGSSANPYAVCQPSTGQNYHSGKKIKHSREEGRRRADGSYQNLGSGQKMAKVPAQAKKPFQGTPRSPEFTDGDDD
jgi:hypothetical protein